jgi:hypothetical protein
VEDLGDAQGVGSWMCRNWRQAKAAEVSDSWQLRAVFAKFAQEAQTLLQ